MNLAEEDKEDINVLIHLGFHKDEEYTGKNYVFGDDNKYIVVLMDGQKIIACAFVTHHKVDVIDNLPDSFMEINNLAIHPDYRGKGLCKELMKQTLSHVIEGRSVRSFHIRLNVFTDRKEPNIPGIKCYKKMGFKFVPTSIERRQEGVYTDMVYVPKQSKKTKKKKKKKQTRKKKKKKKARTQSGATWNMKGGIENLRSGRKMRRHRRRRRTHSRKIPTK